ncbi:hypothetical protein [Cellulomonas sp. Leaf334]|uniref:hypothetical protein n=1 Tax=Cellulomonas sp. Leaf334 TaxID=1736339 RepID=UPI0012E2D7C8|nr:hypothetical protein [Cellulomonas sp. Leaf334]
MSAGLGSLAREATQNSNDARRPDEDAELVYSFIRLTGDARREFEHAANWDELDRHLDSMGQSADAAISAGQIAAGRTAVRDRDDLVLLRVADYGCRGLTGPEFEDQALGPEEFGNFIKLCRMDLYSGKAEAAGGSFGLGKAVYWRFSALQTVLFNSTLAATEAVDGRFTTRLFGVQQGVVHTVDGVRYQGRGYFGVEPATPDAGEDVFSSWGNTELARQLRLERQDERPGTSALLLGFYDPDGEPDEDADTRMVRYVDHLRQGVEENFWPLLTRGRLTVRIEAFDNDTLIGSKIIDPEETYSELSRALSRYDAGDVDEALEKVGDVVVRNVPIEISSRKDGHDAFTHTAKLVVTLSDESPDSLEDQVCLLRRSEMVVETIERKYEGHRYHAFLLAGAAVTKDAPTSNQMHADDFLRFAEPPAHDQWIPRSGRAQASQVNVSTRYFQPWRKNLTDIPEIIRKELRALFGPPPVEADQPPESVVRNLRFFRGEPGSGGTGAASQGRPKIQIRSGEVVDGRWNLTFAVSAPNREAGWSVRPVLVALGADGSRTEIPWHGDLAIFDGGRIVDECVQLDSVPRKRRLSAVVSARGGTMPLRASEAVVDVIVKDVRTAQGDVAEVDA